MLGDLLSARWQAIHVLRLSIFEEVHVHQSSHIHFLSLITLHSYHYQK